MKFKSLLISFVISFLLFYNPEIIKAETGQQQSRENFAVYNAEDLIDGEFLLGFFATAEANWAGTIILGKLKF